MYEKQSRYWAQVLSTHAFGVDAKIRTKREHFILDGRIKQGYTAGVTVRGEVVYSIDGHCETRVDACAELVLMLEKKLNMYRERCGKRVLLLEKVGKEST